MKDSLPYDAVKEIEDFVERCNEASMRNLGENIKSADTKHIVRAIDLLNNRYIP